MGYGMSNPEGPEAYGRGSLSRNMSIALVGNAFPPLVALATGPILAHSLGVSGRGEVAAATAPLALIITVGAFGIPEAVTWAVARSPSIARNAAGRGFLLLTAAGAVAMGLLVVAAPWLSGGDARVLLLIYVASLAVIPSLLVGVLRGVASARGAWHLVALERIITSALRLVAIVPFWLTGSLTPLVATLTIAGMPVVGAVVYFAHMRRLEPRAVAVPPEVAVPGLLGYGVRIWIGSLSGVLLSRLDQVLLTPLAGTFELGLYVVAVNVSELPLIINMAVRDVSFVTDAANAVDDRLATSARVSTLLCAIAGIGIGITMLWWLPLLFGSAFINSIPVAAVLLAAVVLGTPGSIAGSGLSARGRPGLRSGSLVVACVVNVVLIVVLTPTLGAMGAALATLAGNLISSNLNLLLLRREFNVGILQFYGVRRSDLVTLRHFAIRLVARGGRSSDSNGAP